jgi:hypothetical protein
MKQFQVDVCLYGSCGGGRYVACGRNIGTENIRVGDSLGDFTVKSVVAYRNQLDECSPGMTAELTLTSRNDNQHPFTRNVPRVLAARTEQSKGDANQ